MLKQYIIKSYAHISSFGLEFDFTSLNDWKHYGVQKRSTFQTMKANQIKWQRQILLLKFGEYYITVVLLVFKIMNKQTFLL